MHLEGFMELEYGVCVPFSVFSVVCARPLRMSKDLEEALPLSDS